MNKDAVVSIQSDKNLFRCFVVVPGESVYTLWAAEGKIHYISGTDKREIGLDDEILKTHFNQECVDKLHVFMKQYGTSK